MSFRAFGAAPCGLAIALAALLAQPAAAVETVCFPSPSGSGPVWYNQSFFWGGYQYPAGGYSGGVYKPRAYTAADIYVSPPVCFLVETDDAPRVRRGRRMAHHRPHRRCACAS